ncbi:MAG: A/G-specific adenine glycosylase [Sphingomonadaceae bacterium]|nr:A/G-specific adenine glycosylase [Sphingomonadaceae bacterium]
MPASRNIAPAPTRTTAQKLLDWYDIHARQLPWRHPPGAGCHPDPYRVWLSEVMLQQTGVSAVTPRFLRFVERWPDLSALAAANEADVMAEWAGLGYYARARSLIACAKTLVDQYGGIFPRTEPELARLPGIGPYSAAAIAAIAFGEQTIPIDANILRVVARLFAIETPLPAAKGAVATAAARLWPSMRAGDFAQALMDLAARHCTPRAPDCAPCPMRADCAAARHGLAATLPRKATKPPRPMRHGVALWVVRQGKSGAAGGAQVALITRPARGLLGGMRALPGPPWQVVAALPAPPELLQGRHLGRVRHIFTHFALTLDVVAADESALPAGDAPPIWWPLDQIDAAGLPTLFARAAALARAAMD